MIARDGELVTYALDAHTLYWLLAEPERLGAGAREALQSVEAGGARAVVSAIAMAETYYTGRKLGREVTPHEIFAAIDRVRGYTLSPLGRRQLELMGQLTTVSEMHDRLIIADALVHQAVLITRDSEIRRCGLVATLW